MLKINTHENEDGSVTVSAEFDGALTVDNINEGCERIRAKLDEAKNNPGRRKFDNSDITAVLLIGGSTKQKQAFLDFVSDTSVSREVEIDRRQRSAPTTMGRVDISSDDLTAALARMVERRQPYQEQDPNGLDQHARGAKCDAGKPLPALVLFAFARALSEVVSVGTYGSIKYTPDGWLSVEGGEKRYMEAHVRHMLDYAKGEIADPKTGLNHLSQAAWNLLAVIELQQRAAT